MLRLLASHWWIVLLRGIIAIIFGLAAWARPGLTLEFLVFLFGAYAFVSGLLATMAAIGGREVSDDWWVLLLEGLLGMIAGILTYRAPGITGIALLLYIAIWALASGMLQIVAAVRLRKEIEGEFWLGLAGVMSICFAVALMAFPLAGAVALVWLIGLQSIGLGLVWVVLSYKLKGLQQKI